MQQVESTLANAYKDDLYQLNLENEILLAASSGQVEQAAQLMEERGDEPKAIARLFLDTGMYDEAIAYDETMEEAVIDRLYELDQKEKILGLASDSEFMTVEKQIVEYNTDVLDNQISLIENKDTLKRLGLAYIEHEEYEKLEPLQQFLDDQELNQYVERSYLMKDITEINRQIYELSENNEEDKSEEIATLNETLRSKQRELLEIEESLGIDEQ
ncbi:hypothetical protein [Halolactibacillus sp. JCM 19043]|uniref:hypothetical protein n=1 Tax=Halolactibacillus sp. JCM 19043 TaxID=1460638 RepID=UPI000780F66E|nr:hypothetical protein [Halolactibacillus sp. JCM 19043]